MSRSALERQAMRRVRAGEVVSAVPASVAVYQEAEELQESREVKAHELPMHGNTRTFNLNNLLAQNVLQSDYWRSLHAASDYHQVVDEIYNRVEDVGPWATGTSRVPSSAFCLLMKFFVMRLTAKQMKGLLSHRDSPFIRCIGLLYTCPPKDLWRWFEPLLDDAEEFRPVPEAPLMTVGAYVEKLINDMQYYGTTLPRIPVPIERKMKVQMLLRKEKQKLALANRRIAHLLRPGTAVRALYADEENDPAWYDAVVDSVEGNDRYVVTFPEYGNSAEIGLGEVQLMNKMDESRSRSRSIGPGGGAGGGVFGGGYGGGGGGVNGHGNAGAVEHGQDRSAERGGNGGCGGGGRDRSAEHGGGGGRRRNDSRERGYQHDDG
ncbi:unnamed protein product, partial [Phaeothamnion confervicola]